ncbi:MAG: hypothetical protein GY853_14035 [PVC group bacterium]|nr:hypothetical protein [PVC group bacterium]
MKYTLSEICELAEKYDIDAIVNKIGFWKYQYYQSETPRISLLGGHQAHRNIKDKEKLVDYYTFYNGEEKTDKDTVRLIYKNNKIQIVIALN